MKRIPALLATAAMAMSLGACTYETQRDTLTGAIAGTAVGLGLAAIGDRRAVKPTKKNIHKVRGIGINTSWWESF